MKARCCYQGEARDVVNPERPGTRWQLVREMAGWLIPGATLLLLPKCPACIVAYVAVATGLGITMGNAAILRALLVVLCLAMLVVGAARTWRRVRAGLARPT